MEFNILEFIKEYGISITIFILIIIFIVLVLIIVVKQQISSTMQKTIIKVQNRIDRKTKAYNLILEKEFEFYNNINDVFSELVIDIQDIAGYAGMIDVVVNKLMFETIERTKNNLFKLKSLDINYNVYIPKNIWIELGKLCKDLQPSILIILQNFNNKMENKDIEISKLEEIRENIIRDIVIINISIDQRLKVLSNEEEYIK